MLERMKLLLLRLMNQSKNQKLKIRTKSAVIFGIVVITLLSLGKVSNYIFLGLLTILCYRELYQLDQKEDQVSYNHWIATLISNLILFFIFIYLGSDDVLFKFLVWISCFYSVLALLNLHFNFRIFEYRTNLVLHSSFYISYPLLIAALLLTHFDIGNHWLLKIIVLIWVSDSAAYLVGSRIGKNKLFPSVSPNKTIEGSLGAGLFIALFGFGIAYFFGNHEYQYWISMALLVWIFGTYGDLVESKIKRSLKIKDSGNIMPGHGGILDRFDSFIFIWPFIGLFHLFSYS